MFSINDKVVYGAQGVCTIEDIASLNLRGKPEKYYVLRRCSNDASVIYVPFENEELISKMRRILSADEIYKIIESMPDETPDFIEDEAKRKEVCREILVSGDRVRIVRMIKALYSHKKEQQANNRHLHQSDERFLKEGEKLLHEEFALVLNIEPDEVLPFILDRLNAKEA